MKALGASHLKFFVSKQREKERVGFGRSRHECGFLVRRKGVGGGLVLFRANSISSPPSSQVITISLIPCFLCLVGTIMN